MQLDASINNSELSEILADRKKPKLWKNKGRSTQLSPTGSLLKMSRRKLMRNFFRPLRAKRKVPMDFIFVHSGIVFLFRVPYIFFSQILSNLFYWLLSVSSLDFLAESGISNIYD